MVDNDILQDMNYSTAIEVLKTHQAWRKGADIEPTTPERLSLAIDVIISERGMPSDKDIDAQAEEIFPTRFYREQLKGNIPFKNAFLLGANFVKNWKG